MIITPARLSLVLAAVLGLAACGDDKTGTPSTDTKTGDTVFVTDTAPPSDTTAPKDSSTTTAPTDSAVPTDSEAPTDTQQPSDTGTPADTETPQDTAVGPDVVPGCGNGLAEPGELCDGRDLREASCASLGFDAAGALACNGSCDGYDLAGCQPACGNGALDANELCDGAVVVNDATCADLGYSGGTLTCAANCLGADVSSCTTSEVCGNGSVGGPESCDGADLGTDPNGDPMTCEAFGFPAGGTLHCRADCLNWDITGCGEATVPGWTCPPAYYGDGSCDCGCGIPDKDCASGSILACEYCNDAGSCATNPGCAEISPANTGVCVGTVVACGDGEAGPGEGCDGADLRGASCTSLGFASGTLGCSPRCSYDVTDCETATVPTDWLCDPTYFGDGDCDCGCGAKDSDCAGTTDVAECAFCTACAGSGECASRVDNADTTACQSAIPGGWVCDPAWFGDGDCDCGCGAKDSDCAGTADVTQCDYCVQCQTEFEDCATVVDGADTTACASVTATCGDGIVGGREDCDGSALAGASCASLGYASGDLACSADCTFDTRACVAPEVPAGWTCDPAWFGDASCDCGCGAQDLDCATTTDVAACDYCLACPGTGECAGRVDPADTTQCGGAVAGWTCDATWFGDGDCDCGCGAQDKDCDSTTDAAACDYCLACPGSGTCLQKVDGADTTQCAASGIPPGWTCQDSWYADGSCDCGCGAQDFDCATTTGVGECDYCIDCGGPIGASCTGYVATTDTTQCLDTSCGDRIVSGSEDCDGDNLGGATCASLGFDGGALGCNADCTFDTVGCTRPAIPSGWACPAAAYGDGACDCGCGAQDVDCATTTEVRECAACDRCPGAGDCTQKIDATDTTLCSGEVIVPDGWTCDPSYYADGSCDCGCGTQDFDCAATDDVTECVYCTDCPGTGECATRVDDLDTTTCTNPVPSAWSCRPGFYGDGSCDCGCGAQDLDCASTTSVSECAYCEGCGVAIGGSCASAVDAANTTSCAPGVAPAGWTCDTSWYGDGDCDCGCGAQDLDCGGTTDATQCDYCLACPSQPGALGCADLVDGGDTTQCAVPDAWTCDPTWFGDGDCDCGCGGQDLDCAGTTDVTECDYCTACGTGACGDLVTATDTRLCAGVVPDAWTCNATWYGDGACDCGCGAQDADCAGTTDVNECDYCDACAGLGATCADSVDPNDTTLCEGSAPAGWTCSAMWYGDGECDCGCGVKDADCAGTDDATACDWCTACGATASDSCVDFVDARDTTQCYSACGDGVLDPGEECEKADLGGASCLGLGFYGGDLGCSDTCTFDTSLCIVPPTPSAWTCAEAWYGDGSCDCGCGDVDVDCRTPEDVNACAYCITCGGTGACADRVDHADPTTCLPDGWRCAASYFDDATCDCGCGAQDVDCAGTTSVSECDYCDHCGARLGDACGDYVSATDTRLCLEECGNGVVDGVESCDGGDLDGETCGTLGFAGGTLACDATCAFDTSSCLPLTAPGAWTCATSYYGDGTCDCGCGAQDPDCADTSDVGLCDYCLDCPGTGSCATRVDPRDTTLCSATATVPAAWSCPESFYGDGTCDCGCGAQDADCASTSAIDECLYCDACGVAFGDSCAGAVSPSDTTMCQ